MTLQGKDLRLEMSYCHCVLCQMLASDRVRKPKLELNPPSIHPPLGLLALLRDKGRLEEDKDSRDRCLSSQGDNTIMWSLNTGLKNVPSCSPIYFGWNIISPSEFMPLM